MPPTDLDPLAVFALADIHTYLNIPTGVTTDDQVFIQIGNGVSAYIEQRTNTLWKARDYVLTTDGDGRDKLLRLPRPINSVASLTVSGSALVENTDFFVYSDDGTIKLAWGREFCRGRQNVVLDFNAGYTAVPYDIVQAALELFKSCYDELKSGAVSLSSIDIGSVHAILKPGLNPRIEKYLDAQRDLRG